MAEKIDAAIEELKGQMLDTLGTLCTFEAIAPESEGQGEMPKAKYLEKLCKKLGFTDITWVNSKDERVPEGERPNLIVKLPGKDADSAIIAFAKKNKEAIVATLDQGLQKKIKNRKMT